MQAAKYCYIVVRQRGGGGGEEASAAVCCVGLNYRFLPQWMFYHDLAIAAKRRTANKTREIGTILRRNLLNYYKRRNPNHSYLSS